MKTLSQPQRALLVAAALPNGAETPIVEGDGRRRRMMALNAARWNRTMKALERRGFVTLRKHPHSYQDIYRANATDAGRAALEAK